MSQENLKVVRETADAWNRHDLDALMAPCDSDVEYVDRRRFGGDSLRGSEALRAHFASILDMVVELRHESEVVAARDDVVVTRARFSGRARDGGGEAEAVWANVFTFRDGRIVRGETFDTVEEALEAVGLREEDLKQAE